MRLATVPWEGTTSAALVLEGGPVAVRQLPGRDDARSVFDLIDAPLTGAEAARLARLTPLAEPVAWLPPIPHPPKNVLCVGKNYIEHVREGARAEGLSTAEAPAYPIWFTKAHTALLGCGGTIRWDSSYTEALDYEGELAVVIGTAGRRIDRGDALTHVFGYTLLNDVTARDVQQRHKQWFRGKSADTYAPCGPWIVTADAIPDPQNLDIRTRVAGELRQADNTENMLFDIPTLIADISAAVTLEPGDIIATGTPEGVAWGMADPRFLRPGDEVTVECDEIGRLTNTVLA